MERLAAEESWHYRYQHGSVDGSEQPALILAAAGLGYALTALSADPEPAVDRDQEA